MPETSSGASLRSKAFAATALLAALLWLTAFLLIIVQAAAHPLPIFAVYMSIEWMVHIAGTFTAIALTSSEDPRMTRALSIGLNVGDPQLDEVLQPRRRWHARLWVRRALGKVAAVAWTLAAIYTWQVAAGVYKTTGDVKYGLLMVFLCAGGSATVCVVAGACEARRETVFNYLCEMHQRCRIEQDPHGRVVGLRGPRSAARERSSFEGWGSADAKIAPPPA